MFPVSGGSGATTFPTRLESWRPGEIDNCGRNKIGSKIDAAREMIARIGKARIALRVFPDESDGISLDCVSFSCKYLTRSSAARRLENPSSKSCHSTERRRSPDRRKSNTTQSLGWTLKSKSSLGDRIHQQAGVLGRCRVCGWKCLLTGMIAARF